MNYEITDVKSLLCTSIADLEQQIFFVGLINDNGRLIEYSKKQNMVIDDLEANDLTMLCIQTRLHTSMQSDHDKNFGRFGYSIIEREKISLLTIPSVHGTVLVIASNKIESRNLAKKIFQIVYDGCFTKILN